VTDPRITTDPSEQGRSAMNNRHEGITAFLSGWTAAEVSGDTTALHDSLADDFTAVGPLGFTLSKQDWLARHATGALKYETFELDKLQLRRYGDVAVATALQHGQGTYQGNTVPSTLRVTLVVVRQSPSWRLATAHMSFVAGTPGAPPIPGRP
jgi:ketosteroid isomerase-like protein